MVLIDRSQTIADVLSRVGAKLDVTVTDNSTPSSDQVVQWLNDGSLLMVKYMPPHRLGSLMFVTTESDVGEYWALASTDMLRPVAVKKFGVECARLVQRDLDLVITQTPLLFTTRNPAFAVSGEAGALKLQFWPASLGPVSVKGIKRPTAFENDAGWAPDQWSLPAELELNAIDYAVIQGKIQDEEIEQATILKKEWTQELGIEMQIDALGVD